MASSESIPLPYVVVPSQSWDGVAGSWSSFIMRVGTPPQYFKILPTTITGEVWIPVPQGCTRQDLSSCAISRGVLPFEGIPSSGFQTNQSSTWISNGLYQLDIETCLNLSGNGQYGFDSVGLGFQDSGGPTLTHQVLAGIATKDFYLGVLGLGPKPANLSDFNEPQPTFLSNLASQRLIPSLSFGYTAGARYRLKGALGSLTLGGYDSSRFLPNCSMTFTFDPDDSRSLTVAIQSVTATNTLQGVIQPLTAGILSLIDSSVPDIWLPAEICQVFEQAFGLIYDPTMSLYLINNTVHTQLLDLNPSIIFKLANGIYGGPYININLPYAALDLHAQSPLYPNRTNYFPLRRAINESQYTLGRTFLQEAYIIVDYERSNFTVAPAVFLDPNPQHIVSINSTKVNTGSFGTPSGTKSSQPLRKGAVTGIAIGAAVMVLVGITAAILTIRWSRRRRHPHAGSTVARNSQHGASQRGASAESESEVEGWKPPELLGSAPRPAAPQEIDGSCSHELVGSLTATELGIGK